jgi:hypothetical protein
MPFYRDESGRSTLHINFGRRAGPAPCRGPLVLGDDPAIGAHCGRISVALCDAPAGQTLDGKPVTCDMPMCERHRTNVGPNLDHCPRHAKQQRLPEGL